MSGGSVITAAARKNTAGVYHLENLVMKRSVGDLRSTAFCTISSIRAIVESSNGPAASTSSSPSSDNVPPCTSPPGDAVVGIDSPVIA